MDRRATLALTAVAACALALLGWREFYFLTDDAFIAFRYASHAYEGRGLVWNPAPFLPVEGYTCWLWVVMLWGVWEATGIQPPQAAGPLALAFGLGSLGIAMALALRTTRDELGRVRTSLFAVVLLGIVSNRSFLAWLSSGLETALFNFAFTAWFALALAHRTQPRLLTTAGMASAGAAAALTRPDGWLAVAGSLAIFAAPWLTALRAGQRPPSNARRGLALASLALPAIHLLWRHAFYGEWLPNTYYAKYAGAWPESGLRYAASFALEYALWIWLGAALGWGARLFAQRTAGPKASGAAAAERLDGSIVAPVVAVGVLVAHFAYYTFAIGGDHFEYRVYSHLIPLLFVSFPWLVTRCGVSWQGTLLATACFVLLSWPIPWAHHLATRNLTLRSETHELVQPVAPLLPAPLSWLAAPFDALQAWLIPRHVGMRHREHVTFLAHQRALLPSRAEGRLIGWEGRPVLAAGNVGLVGWVLPNVAVLDVAGLNDYVAARTSLKDEQGRRMAHDRMAPQPYLECYQPNVTPRDGRIVVIERIVPLDDAAIARCEAQARAAIDDAGAGDER